MTFGSQNDTPGKLLFSPCPFLLYMPHLTTVWLRNLAVESSSFLLRP